MLWLLSVRATSLFGVTFSPTEIPVLWLSHKTPPVQSSLGSCNLLVVTQNSENKYEVYTDLHKREETAAVSASWQMLKLWKYRQWASSEKNQMGNPRTVVCRSMEIQRRSSLVLFLVEQS